MNLNKIVSNNGLGSTIKLVLIGVGVVIVYRWIRTKQKNLAIMTESTAGATLSDTQIAGLATKIESSWGVFNDDETSVYNAFMALGNKQDLIKLMRKYYYKGESLQQSITKRMSNREINKINNILKSKGIDYAF